MLWGTCRDDQLYSFLGSHLDFHILLPPSGPGRFPATCAASPATIPLRVRSLLPHGRKVQAALAEGPVHGLPPRRPTHAGATKFRARIEPSFRVFTRPITCNHINQVTFFRRSPGIIRIPGPCSIWYLRATR